MWELNNIVWIKLKKITVNRIIANFVILAEGPKFFDEKTFSIARREIDAMDFSTSKGLQNEKKCRPLTSGHAFVC